MRRSLLTAASALVFAVALLIPTGPVTAAQAEPAGPPAADADSTVIRINRELRGVVLAWKDGRSVRLAGAHVGTGETTVQTDADGRFVIPAEIRTNQLNVVAPGYHVVRKQTTADYVVIFARPLEVRSLYIPYDALRRQEVIDWALALARQGVVTSFVIDVKDEGGSVLPMVANQTARDLNAIRDPLTDVQGFLDELGNLGIYRIARVVTFLDSRLAVGRPNTALRDPEGKIFRDSLDLAWTNPFVADARRHNVEIGVLAAKNFEEIQYDYVRLPTDPGVVVRAQHTGAQRSAQIAQFAMEAATALHAVGAAISFDTFGQTTVISDDGGIGQILEDLAPFLDYYSPMVYPSTWTPGWFGFDYPPAEPFQVVLQSVARAVERLEPFNIVVRPWLQDFHDYQAQKLFYGLAEVDAQIRANVQAGGNGYMLWDPSLNYQLDVLVGLAVAGQ